MKPVVLITGGSSLLALNWALTMRDRYTIVLGLHKRRLDVKGVESQSVDIESIDQLALFMGKISPQIVIHAAGLTNVEQCEADPELAHWTNVEIAVNVAKTCSELDLQMMHISTDHLFAGEVPLVDEAYPIAPINTYGFTKAEAERRVIEVHPNALVVRTNFYGWGPSYRNSFSDVIINSLRDGKELTLFDDVFYTPTIIESLSCATHDLITLQASGIFNVVGDDRISKYEFGLRVAEKFNLDRKLIKSGSLAKHVDLVRRPFDMSLSNHKVCNYLGRTLGGIDQHLEMLYQQEQNGFAQEIRQQ